MGGRDSFHSGKLVTASRLTYTAGAQKWAKTLPSSAHATGGVAVGDLDDPNDYEYKFYVGADDDKVYCYQVSYNSGNNTFSVDTNPVWTYTCDGDPIGTPVLGVIKIDQTPYKVIYICDATGRLHCINDSDGSRRWRSADLTSNDEMLTAPLLFTGHLYIGRSSGHLITFTMDPGSGSSEAARSTDETAGPVVRTPAGSGGPDDQPEEDLTYWYVYTASSDATLEQWRDRADLPNPVEQWNYPAVGGGQTCETWPMLGSDSRIYFGTYDNSSNQGRVYDVDFYDDGFGNGVSRWSAMTNERVDTARNSTFPVTYPAIGQLKANPCNDIGPSNPVVYYPTMDLASGSGKPSMIKIIDLSPGTAEGDPYFLVKMSLDGDDITSTPIFNTDGSTVTYIYHITVNGKFWATTPSGNVPVGWPKTLSETIPQQDLAMDADLGVIFVTADGDIKAYWGK